MAITGDFPYCAICSSTINWQPHNCPMSGFGFVPPATTYIPQIVPTPPVPCDHCFCINEKPRTVGVKQEYSTDYVRTKAHQVCCSCQSRRLRPPRRAKSQSDG